MGAAGRRPDEIGSITGHTWVSPEALVGDPRLRHPMLPGIAALAVRAVR